jgi:phosphatidylglycerophosphatase A
MRKQTAWRDEVACAVATTLYSGCFPVAPGTVGAALAGVVLWFLRIDQGLALSGLLLLVTLVGVWAAGRAEARWGKDPGRVNWDEVAGMMVSLLFLPRSVTVFIMAFILFRFFDILKPPPVNTAEKLPGGWGIMADDLMAGLYTNIIMQLVVRFWLMKG